MFGQFLISMSPEEYAAVCRACDGDRVQPEESKPYPTPVEDMDWFAVNRDFS